MTAGQQPEHRKLYSAPRRYDLATVFVATTAFALLYASLDALEAAPIVVFVFSTLLALVAFAQAFLFRGKRARLASFVTGMVFSSIVAAVLVLNEKDSEPEYVVPAMLFSVFPGLFGGYIAGVSVGAIFMVAEFLRKLLGGSKP